MKYFDRYPRKYFIFVFSFCINCYLQGFWLYCFEMLVLQKDLADRQQSMKHQFLFQDRVFIQIMIDEKFYSNFGWSEWFGYESTGLVKINEN